MKRAAAYIVWILLIPASARALPSLARRPYIQMVTPSSAVIVWNTGTPITGTVDYGPTPALGRLIQDGRVSTVHVVRIGGLTPATTYYYRVLGGGQPFPDAAAAIPFMTAPVDPAAPFSFIVFGDLGCGCPAQKALAQAMGRYPFSFALLTGDIVYPDGSAPLYSPRFFDVYGPLLASRPFYPTLGNHDLRTDHGRPYLNTFVLPANNPEHTKRYYSFDYGSAHIIGLDTFSSDYTPGSAQYRWLEDDLKNHRPPWTFVFFHDPPYSSSRHASNLVVRKSLSPLFERFGVTAVFAGHDHCYERTVPLRDFARHGRHVVYIVSGGGGADLYPVGANDFTAFSSSRHHFVLVRVTRDRATLWAVGTDGRAFDSTTFARAPEAGPTP